MTDVTAGQSGRIASVQLLLMADRRTRRAAAAIGPMGREGPADRDGDPFSNLFARRHVWLRAPLDDDAANQLAAQLLALDRESAEPIELIINSPGGPVGAALEVIDTMDLLRSPVATLCLGQAMGTAAAVLACGRGGRRVTPTSRVSLRLPASEVWGTAARLAGQAEQLLTMRDHLAMRLAAATGHLPAVIVVDLDGGGFMTAEQAVGYGVVDGIAGRSPSR